MPTTSNFGWTTPADTDLVKDGAAAIRTLGNGIDTSLVDLKGGTTGQILSKNSNTDLDYTWVTPNVGDITEVQAGTGISVASGTGPIPVVTNTVATTFDAKGDLVVGTGADTFAKLSVGTNDYVLTAASGEATGVKWAAVPAASGPSFCAYMTNGGTDQTPSNLTFTKIIMDTEQWDSDSCYDTTNRRFTPNKSGYYLYTFALNTSANASTGRREVAIFKNGSELTTPYTRFGLRGVSDTDGFISGSTVIYANGTTDYFELYVNFNASTSRSVYTNTNGASTVWTGTWIRS